MRPLADAPRSALIIALRYLGDVLLATPIASTVKQLYRGCQVDMLVFNGSEPMLEGNPDLRSVIATREGASVRERLAQMRALWRRYDLAVVTAPGDPPVLFGFAAARQRVGFIPVDSSTRRWKRAVLTRSCCFDPRLPRIAHNDQLAKLLGVPQAAPIVAPTAGIEPSAWHARLGFDALHERFAVVHPAPRWRYKQWTDAGWRALVRHLRRRIGRVLISGGPAEAERTYLDRLDLAGDGVLRLDGKLRIAEATDLLRLATVYVGPDTAMTHVAAACATPTLALYGPTDPVIWGPTPAGVRVAAYEHVAASQRRGNVLLLQNPDLACVPCQLEGCARHRESHSDCLDRLTPERVLVAVEQLLGTITTAAP